MKKKINLNNLDLTIMPLNKTDSLKTNISFKKKVVNIKSVTLLNQMCFKYDDPISLYVLYYYLYKVKSLFNFKTQLTNSTELMQIAIPFFNPISLNQYVKIIL